MGLTPQQKMMNYRERIRDNPDKHEKIKLKDRERNKKTRLNWSKQKKKSENRKNCERTRKYRLSLSFAKELKNDANNSFVQDKTPKEILHLLKTENEMFDQSSKAFSSPLAKAFSSPSVRKPLLLTQAKKKRIFDDSFSSTPVRTPSLLTHVKTPHTLNRNNGIFKSASKAVTSTPSRTPKFICSIKRNKASKAIKSTPARISFSASKAIKYTPARTPLSASKGIKSTPLRTPLTASKAIKSTPVRTPFSSSKKKTLNEKNKQTPSQVCENIRKKITLHEKIEQFFVKNTWLCRRNKKLKIKPRVLMIPMKSLHKAFCDENPDLCVSLTKFSSLKPPKLQVVKKVDFTAFFSIYGGSSKMIINEILKVCVDLPEHLRNLMSLNICDRNKKACISGTCKKCTFNENISSTDEMEDKIALRDDKSTMSGTQSKMNIIEKFVIGAFTPPPDLKPLQFHEVSRILQTRLQENKKNINIVKIIQGPNKSPKLQIQVEKKIRKPTEECKENKSQEKIAPIIENKGKNKTVPKTVLTTKSNKDAVKGSKISKSEIPKDEETEKQLLNQRKSRKSIEKENVQIISSSVKKGTNNAKKDTGKTKIEKNIQSPKRKNSRAKKTGLECVQTQSSTDEKSKKGMRKQDTNKQVNLIDDTNKDKEDGVIKSIAKENVEKDKKLAKKAIRSRSRTNEKEEKNLKSKQIEHLKDDSSNLQASGTRKAKNERNDICHSSENSKKFDRNDTNKNSQNQIINKNIDVDSTSEVSSTPDQSFYEFDESFSLVGKKGKSKPKKKIPLNPVEHKQRERRQSKITTFLSAENSQNNKSVKNLSNKTETETLLQNVVESTIEKVIEKCKQDEKGSPKNRVQKEPENVNVSKKNVDKDRLKKLKKVRRSIVGALNESALSELDTSVIGEVDGENELSSRKRKSSISSPEPNNEYISKAPVNKKRKSETQILESENVQKEPMSNIVAKNKRSNSNKKTENKEETKSTKKDQKNAAEANTAKSGNKNTKNKAKAKTVAVEKDKKINTKEQINVPEKIKPDENNEAASAELLIDSAIEKNSKEKDPENIALSKTIMDKEKLKKMKKVRRSIVGQLNESALSDMDIDLVDEIDKENKVDDKKTQSAKTKAKPNKKDMSEVPIDKKKEAKTIQLKEKKTKKSPKAKKEPKPKKVAKPKESKSKKKPVTSEMTKSPQINNRAAAEAKARELLMPEDCPITANLGTMKYLEQRSTLLKAIDNQRESDGDIFSSNIFKRRSGVSNLLDSDNIDDTFAIRTPNCKGTTENHDGMSPFTPRTGMFADWADLANVSTHKTPTTFKTLPTPTVDTEHKKVVNQVTYHMQKNKRRGIRKLQTTDENDEKAGPKSRKKNKSLLDLPNMPEDEIDDLGDDYFF